jgi:hypothetical protein
MPVFKGLQHYITRNKRNRQKKKSQRNPRHDDPRFWVENINRKLEGTDLRTKFSARIKEHKETEIKHWENRDYKAYNILFMPIFKKEIHEVLKDIYDKNRRPLHVVVDGGGREGIFPSALKTKLNQLNVPSNITVISLKAAKELKDAKTRGEFDVLREGEAEFFVPEQKIDVVISLFDSIHYTMDELRKSHILKYAYSLNKGGIMMVGFGFQDHRSVLPRKRLPAEPVPEEELIAERKGIKRAFKKKGFEAEFYDNVFPVMRGVPTMPRFVLVVKRIM